MDGPSYVKAGARGVRPLPPGRRRDTADVPVIAVILLVALVIVIAAGVFVFVSNFNMGDAPKAADPGVLASTGDNDRDGNRDYIRVLLVIASNGPFYSDTRDEVTIAVADGEGTYTNDDGAICVRYPDSISLAPLTVDCGTGNTFGQDDNTKWEEGQILFAPCMGKGPHDVLVAIKDVVVYQAQVECGEMFGE